MNFDFAQIISFSKDRFYRILKNVFLSQIFEKIVKFDTETLEKAEIMKIDGKKISALPPETRKWRKTKISAEKLSFWRFPAKIIFLDT